MNNKKQRAFVGGSYSLVVTVLVLVILIVVNVLAGALPATYTKFDISSSKLYSVTSNTKAVVNNLNKDVTIYWIVQADQEDEILENLLAKYDSLSEHLSVVKKNPDIYPAFAAQYTDEDVRNNSLAVVCGDRNRFISYSDIYLQEADMYSYSYNTSFDGEGAITSAIDYVTNEDLPKVYYLTGHGERDLPSSFTEQLEKENIDTEELSLLTIDQIPEDCDCIMIYAPESDISDTERTMITAYAAEGGKLFVMAGPAENSSLENLYGILAGCGVEESEGIVVEGDRNYYAFQQPPILIPDMVESDITKSLIEERYLPIMPLAGGLTITAAATTAKEILGTSDTAFSKVAGFGMESYEKEEGDIDGPFSLAVSVDIDGGGKIVWYSVSDFLEDMYNAYSSGANVNLAMNSLSYLIGEREVVAIRAKSLNYSYLTISDSEAAMLKVVMIGILPLLCLGTGIIVFANTRRKQNEAV